MGLTGLEANERLYDFADALIYVYLNREFMSIEVSVDSKRLLGVDRSDRDTAMSLFEEVWGCVDGSVKYCFTMDLLFKIMIMTPEAFDECDLHIVFDDWNSKKIKEMEDLWKPASDEELRELEIELDLDGDDVW